MTFTQSDFFAAMSAIAKAGNFTVGGASVLFAELFASPTASVSLETIIEHGKDNSKARGISKSSIIRFLNYLMEGKGFSIHPTNWDILFNEDVNEVTTDGYP